MFGMVVFDNPKTAGDNSGWASLAGDTAFRIQAAHDLPQDARWLSNLTYDAITSRTAFRRTTIKHERYLRTSINHLSQEIGVDKFSADSQAMYLGYIFNNVMRGAIEYYGLDPAKAGKEDSLTKDMAQAYGLSDIPCEQAYALDDSYQNVTHCGTEWQKDVIYTWIRRHRLDHAHDVLNCPVPAMDAAWQQISDSELDEQGGNLLDYLLRYPQPVLIEATVTNVSHEVSELIGLGNIAGGSGFRRDRHWFSQPELLWIALYADVTVKKVLRSSHYELAHRPDNGTYSKRLAMPVIDRCFDRLSTTAGLLAENYWVALGNRVGRKLEGGKYQSFATATGCWIRSVDRLLCFITAMQLKRDLDLNIMVCGVGSISVNFEAALWDEIKQYSQENGLIMPIHPPEPK